MSKTKSKVVATATLLSDGKKKNVLDISKGRGDFKEIGPGSHEIQFAIDARFSSPFGPKNDKGPLHRGFPFGKTFMISWKVEVDDDGSAMARSSSKSEKKSYLMPGDSTELSNVNQGSKFVSATVKIDGTGLKEKFDYLCKFKAQPAETKKQKTVKKQVKKRIGSFPLGKVAINGIKGGPSDYLNRRGLVAFLDSLPSLTKEMITNGKQPGNNYIFINGYADTTGPEPENLDIAYKRAVSVMKAIQKWSGNSKKNIYRPRGHGSGKKGGAKGKPDDRLRFAEISMVCEAVG